MSRPILLLLICVLTLHTATAQNAPIDSLKRLLAKTRQDTSRVLIMNQLAYRYHNYSTDSSLKVARQALELAQKIRFLKGEGHALNYYAGGLRDLGDLPKALSFSYKALAIAREIKDWKLEADALNSIGLVYSGLRQYQLIISYCQQSRKVSELHRDTTGIIREYNNMVLPFLGLNLVDSARMALQKAQWYDNHFMRPVAGSPLSIYRSNITRNAGRIEASQGNTNRALQFFRQAIVQTSLNADRRNLGAVQFYMAELFSKLHLVDSSLHYARQALGNGRLANNLSIPQISYLLAQQFKAQNKPDSVIYYLELTKAANDSLFGSRKIQQLQLLTIAEQQRQQELVIAQQEFESQVQLYTVLAGLVVVAMIAFVLYRNNRQKHRANQLLNEQKTKVEQTLETLKTTQTQLIQCEKMASLGELTAGIAHEIQNPLNFVNNFSEVSVELIDELKEEAQAGRTNDVLTIADDLSQNLQRITLNGQRASNIVKGMLEHSRTSTGERAPTDLNALCDEYLRLAYQGIRAKSPTFTCQLNTHFTPGLPLVEVVTQDISRVLLNLFNNAFYAVGQKQKTASPDYQPTVWVSTNQVKGHLEIRVRDNGMGIPDAIKEKIFQPFFTTKPTGEGTGLGLSLSYDIITKGHRGMLEVASEAGQFTEFVIILPIILHS